MVSTEKERCYLSELGFLIDLILNPFLQAEPLQQEKSSIPLSDEGNAGVPPGDLSWYKCWGSLCVSSLKQFCVLRQVIVQLFSAFKFQMNTLLWKVKNLSLI